MPEEWRISQKKKISKKIRRNCYMRHAPSPRNEFIKKFPQLLEHDF